MADFWKKFFSPKAKKVFLGAINKEVYADCTPKILENARKSEERVFLKSGRTKPALFLEVSAHRFLAFLPNRKDFEFLVISHA